MFLPSIKIDVFTQTGVPPFLSTTDELLLEGDDGFIYGLGGKARFLNADPTLGDGFLCGSF